jgi:ubiquinone/menaquinone biosynthesis C-methylase UbiE
VNIDPKKPKITPKSANQRPQSPKPAKKSTSWGNVAEWYDNLLTYDEDSFQAKVILPNLLRRVAPAQKNGGQAKSILDLACGQGYFTREWVKGGAQVIASDIAAPLIAIAQKEQPLPKKYFVSSADDLSSVESNSQDAVTIVLALQNIQNLAGVCSVAARILKPKGTFYIVLNHPAFRIPKLSSWGWDETQNKQYRRIDSYMSESRTEIDMTPGKIDTQKKQFTISFHRPLQVYVKALAKAGLSVTHLEEWISHKESRPDGRGPEENRIRKEIPMFLLLEATKI